MTRHLRTARPFLPLLLLLLAGCVVNPVTGSRQFMLFTEGQEIELGRSSDVDVVSSLGLYDDPQLAAWIHGLGQELARGSERPNLPWTFRLLDDPTVNAFALPGGYIYITRGILGHLSSEAELVGILGHEIGHVTARHGVARVSQAQLAQLGLGIGMVLAPDLQLAGELAGAGLQLLFLSNSRDAERQADDLGLRYMTAQGYDPREMAATFEMLARASGAEDGERIPGFLSTHPDPLERRSRILARVQTGELVGDRVESESFLRRIEGLPFGENPREGFFRDGIFYHPDLAFRMSFPAGWRTLNQRNGVQAVSPDQDAALLLTIESATGAVQARDAFARGEGITPIATRSRAVNGLSGAEIEFRATSSGGGVVRGVALFVEHGGAVYRLLGYSVDPRWGDRAVALANAQASFRPEVDPAILSIQPPRIRLERISEAMTLETFQARFPSVISLEQLGTINRLRAGELIPSGTLLKRVIDTSP